MTLEEAEAEARRKAIRAAMVASEGHKGDAAAALKISVSWLGQLIDRLDMGPELAEMGSERGWPTPIERARAAEMRRRKGARRK